MRNEPCRPTTASAIGESFDEVVLPHLDAAYRLALWLMRNEHDAEDVVQEACWKSGLPQRAHPREQDAQEADAVVPPSDVENDVGETVVETILTCRG